MTNILRQLSYVGPGTDKAVFSNLNRDIFSMPHAARVSVGSALLLFVLLAASASGEGTTSAPSSPDNGKRDAFAAWWSGKYATGDWLGLRDVVSDQGLKFEGRWRAAYYGVLASEGGQRGFFDQEFAFGALLNFDELANTKKLEGLVGFAEVRWRDPASADDPNTVVEASNLFNPSPYESGVGWRFVQFGLRYTVPEFLGAEDAITLTAGWLRPYREFLVQPLSVNFLNTAIQLAKGLGGNIPFSSSFSSWGGVAEVKPVRWHYVKAGLFMSYPEATASDNHGLMMGGSAENPSDNGLYFMGETGVTPEIGPDRLPGKYAFGAYYYGENNEKYGSSKYGFYWQADQMLYREAGQQSIPTAKDSASPKAKLSDQGLRMFSMLAFAPPYNNRYPLYAQAGLAYEGAVPGRDKDLSMAAVGSGQYANAPGKTSTTVIELGYRVQINQWAYFQPSAQYIVQPDGSPNVANAAIIGFFAGLNF